MAGGGGGEGDENPVPVNCVALVDVIFCLCIFFMCSFHFKQLEGRVDAWLPKDKGPDPALRPVPPILEEIRVSMRWAADHGARVRKVVNSGASPAQQMLHAILTG